MNRSRHFAKENMYTADKRAFRPEQQLARDIIVRHMPRDLNFRIIMEHTVDDLKVEGMDYTGNHAPRLDIVVLIKQSATVTSYIKKIGIRLMGEIHDEQRIERKDKLQEAVLRQNGWTVVDFVYWKMPGLFKELDEEKAFDEIKTALIKSLVLLEYP